MDKSAPTVIARAWTEAEASVIKSLLASYGIHCYCASGLVNRFYPVPDEELGHIRIFVPASLAKEAENILEEHRRHTGLLHAVED